MLPQPIPTVDVSEIPDGAVLLDVREDEEWNAGHIAGARHVPMFQVPQHFQYADDLTAQTKIVVICKMGGRSAQVTGWLAQNGYDAVNLEGGMLAWATSGRDLVSEDGQPPRVA